MTVSLVVTRDPRSGAAPPSSPGWLAAALSCRAMFPALSGRVVHAASADFVPPASHTTHPAVAE
jgi:hypothetical protein